MVSGDSPNEEPLNVRLKHKVVLSADIKIVPRRYQEELCQTALVENVIIYLGTGLGKTFIVVMFLNSPQIAEQIYSKRKVVFLAPTQDLIKQQAEYINRQVPFKVKIFCGRTARCGEHIDHWDKHAWNDELEKVDILFMTPQILSAAVATNLIDWSRIGAVIFDEVHHASKSKKSGHQYVHILGSFHQYYKYQLSVPQPRLIGLTASLINRMPKQRDDITDEIRHLELQMKARCVTDITVQDIRPRQVIHTYSSFKLYSDNDTLCKMFSSFQANLDDTLKSKKAKSLMERKDTTLIKEYMKLLSFHNRLRLAAAGFSIKPGSFPKVIMGLNCIRQRCGLWALKAVCHRLIDALDKHRLNSVVPQEMKPLYLNFTEIIKKIYFAVENFLGPSNEKALLAYTRPKSKSLLDILKYEYDRTRDGSNGKSSFSCIIFVRSRLEVVALNEWLQQVSRLLPDYNFIRANYAVGLAATMASKYSCITKRKATEQSAMLDQFRKGHLNVIVTTSVLEEGIDLPVCSTVIRYDQPNNFREYVQSRGRARQDVSSLIAMCEFDKTLETVEKMDIFHDFELTVKKALISNRVAPQKQINIQRKPEDQDDFFIDKEGKVRITSTTAKVILNMYCNRLSLSNSFTEKIRYDRVQPDSNTVQTTLYLPSGCPLSNGIVGGVKSCEQLADNSAIIAAIRALRDAGELDESGVPTRVTERNVDNLLDTLDLAPKFEKLDSNLEGVCEEDETVYFFKAKIFDFGNCLSNNISERRYKLLKIRFVPDQNNSRRETYDYFTKPVFGIVVDSSTSSEFIPAQIHSHYGLMKVESETIADNIRIDQIQDHNDLLNFTHRLLTRCLSLRFINRDQFKKRCNFYIVPLNSEGKRDPTKMREYFRVSMRDIRVGDIVKVRYIARRHTTHTQRYQKGSNQRGKDQGEQDEKLLVRAIRSDLRPNSKIPNGRETFLANIEYQYGNDISRSIDLNQKIIEVMPISKEFGKIKEGKKTRREYSTDSRFYIEQFLERFESDADSVFQAFNLPEMINKIYIHLAASNLDRKFVQESSQYREIVVNDSPRQSNEIEGVYAIDSAGALDEDAEQGADVQDEDAEKDGDRENIDGSYEHDSEDDESDLESDVDSLESQDSDLSDSELLVGPQYEDMISKNTLDLEDNDDKEEMKPWKFHEYKVKDLASTRNEFRTSKITNTLEGEAQFAPTFLALEMEVSKLQNQLIDKLVELEHKFTSDSSYLDESEEFKKRTSTVDSSIKPPIMFDRCKRPLKDASRNRSVIEALTLRRAIDTYNLECLEHVGDSFLKYVISVVLFKSLDGNEGFLTSTRSRLTCNKYFTHLAKKRELGKNAITRPFSKDLLELVLGREAANRREEKSKLNQMRAKDLADTFEALVGSYLVHIGEFEAILAIDWLGLHIIREGMFEEFHNGAVVFSRVPTALVDNDNAEMRKYFNSCKIKFRRFEDVIGYKFNDPSYLIQAFTHPSAIRMCTRSYQRLEFLGDALLDYEVTMTLVHTASTEDPGQLTSSRSAIVNNYSFAKVAMNYKFDLFIQHANHEIYDELTKVRVAMEEDQEMSFLDMIDYDRVAKLLGDVFESVAGAIYLDSGCSLDTVWSIYYPMLKSSIDQEIAAPTKNITSLLYETFPGKGRIQFQSYDVKTDDGDMYGVLCSVSGFGQFEGRGQTRAQAKKRAVVKAMEKPPSAEVKARLDKEFMAKMGPTTRAYEGRRSSAFNRNRNRNQQDRHPQAGPSAVRGSNKPKYFRPG